MTAEKKLIPDTDSGELQMEFTFDATKLNGEQVVVFEEVYLEEKLVAVHADLEDEGQSVTYKKEKQVKHSDCQNCYSFCPHNYYLLCYASLFCSISSVFLHSLGRLTAMTPNFPAPIKITLKTIATTATASAVDR